MERVRQRDRSKAVGTGRTKLAMCLQERRGGSCGLPGPAVTWLWGSRQRKRANRSRQTGKNQKQSPWLFLDIFWGQVGIGRGCTSVKSSDGGSWESVGEVKAQAAAEQRGQSCGDKGTSWSRDWPSRPQGVNYNPQRRVNQLVKMSGPAAASTGGLVHRHAQPISSPALEP